MIKAILAYDCKTNPNLTIAPGPLHTYWDALWQAKSCIDVPNLNPDNVSCSGDGFACLPGKGVESVLLECDDKVTHAETCMLEGKVCGGLECVTPSAKKDCDPPSCEGSVLHACAEGGVDEGYDCQYFGLGACVDDGGAGCSPNTMNGFGSCAQGATVTCDAGVAVGCVAGTSETVVCDNLTGQGTCEGGTPNWNVAGACQGSGSCKPSCAGDTLTGCAQGATFTVNCKDVGLGPCREVALPATTTGYACASP
jgi:hypothetical protein